MKNEEELPDESVEPKIIDDYEENVDDFYDESFDDYYDDDYIPEDNPRFGEEQFNRTLEDKDYYKKKDEEYQKELLRLKEEAEKDTMELPKEKDNEKAPSQNNVDTSSKQNSNVFDPFRTKMEDNWGTPQDSKDKDKSSEEENNIDDDKSSENSDEDSENKEKQDKQNSKSDDKEEDENSNKKKKQKDDDREVVAVKEDGTKVVKKNAQDHKKDQQNIKNLERQIKNNKIDQKMAKAYSMAHPVQAAKQKVKTEIKKKVVEVIGPYVLIGVGIIFAAILLFCVIGGFISAVISNDANESNIAGYYNAPCQEITVYSAYDAKHNTYTEAGTYSVEDYVAGVISAEVGSANNMEVYKAFAIAIRTYTFRNVDSSCGIENSAAKQVFHSTTNENYIQAANETKGIVLVDESGSLLSTQYDALAMESYDDNYVTIKQQNQQIPISWITNNVICNANFSAAKAGNLGMHGNGMSQCGAYYLGSTGYTYDQILKYYYGDFVYKSTFLTTNIEGLDYPLENERTVILRVPLSDFLNSQTADGFTTLNQRITDKVNEVGYQTKGGVVAAGVTLIGEVALQGYRVPYYWGGGHGDGVSSGARGYWGGSSTGSSRCYTKANGIIYDLCGLDCSGFVNWAIYNGGFKAPSTVSGGYEALGEAVSLNPNEPVVEPGDLIHTPGHIVLVVGIDEANKQYIIAEAGGYRVGVKFSRRSFGLKKGTGIRMDKYYNNDANKR